MFQFCLHRRRVKCMRGGGTRAASRARKSNGSSTMCVVPSRYGGLEPIAHVALGCERQPLDRHRGAAHVAGQPFQLVTLLGFDADARSVRRSRNRAFKTTIAR